MCRGFGLAFAMALFGSGELFAVVAPVLDTVTLVPIVDPVAVDCCESEGDSAPTVSTFPAPTTGANRLFLNPLSLVLDSNPSSRTMCGEPFTLSEGTGDGLLISVCPALLL